MKFIHTADLHLDSPLRGLSAYPEAPADRLRTATRDAFERLVTYAIDEAVDFMVIAGDVYDGDWKDFNTGLFFVRQMGYLQRAGIHVFLLYGNHDAESEMTRELGLPNNVHVFSAQKAESFRLEALRVVLHGRSFKHRETTENLVPTYPEALPGWLNIGVLHTALEGRAEHARYAPCSLEELQAKGYQYWALGHVHERWIARGEVTVAWPGNLQGRHVRECGARGALLVTAEDGAITGVEPCEVDVLRWHRLEVDLAAAPSLAAVPALAGAAMERLLADEGSERLLALRVAFTGDSALHRALLRHETQLRQEVIAQALMRAPERLWIEKVQIATRMPSALSQTLLAAQDTETADALVLLETLAKTAVDDGDFMRGLQQGFQEVLGKVPPDLWQALPELADFPQDPAQFLAARMPETLAELMARLGKPPEADR